MDGVASRNFAKYCLPLVACRMPQRHMCHVAVFHVSVRSDQRDLNGMWQTATSAHQHMTYTSPRV